MTQFVLLESDESSEAQSRFRRTADFLAEVVAEYERAAQQHGPLQSAHEAYAVILEEVSEFWEEVRKKREVRDADAMRQELIQVVAMCLRTVLDLSLHPEERGQTA